MNRSLPDALAAARAAGSVLLIASLPANELAFADEAVAGGADALKMHANIRHRAGGRGFGTLADEATAVRRIREAHPNLPLGLVLGEEAEVVERDLGLARELGVDFISAYVHAAPARALAGLPGVMLAFDAATPHAFAARLGGLAVALEASIIPADGYGRVLEAADVLRYADLAARSPVPLVVPTQRRVRPADLPALRRAGVSGLMFGAVVAGDRPEGFRDAARAFREALA